MAYPSDHALQNFASHEICAKSSAKTCLSNNSNSGASNFVMFVKIAESEHNIPISINALVREFDCPRSSVQSALAHGLEPPGERGKHPALVAGREQQILDWIQ
jgi:hypothetical protein